MDAPKGRGIVGFIVSMSTMLMMTQTAPNGALSCGVTEMGQRSQIIVILPAVYYNSDNPNNRGKRVVVYHNQWLYGCIFLKYIKKLLSALEYSKANHYAWNSGWVEDGLDKAIDYANHSDLDCMTETRLMEDGVKDYNEDLVKARSAMGFVKTWDNNNGFIIVELDEAGNARFDILNGLEDADTITRRTPQGYLNLFYDAEKQAAGSMGTAIEDLSPYPIFDGVDALNKLRMALKAEAKKC